jgi:hypothetical protein
MEQRPPRLGDQVDDYCPRERRITSHAIVAIVDDTIRHTRCTACDVEHDYREARVPKKPVKNPHAVNGASTDLAGGVLVSPAAARAAAANPAPTEPASPPVNADPGASPDSPAPPEEERAVDGWLAHRPLIRASLPRQENAEPPPRPIPEFTMHQRPPRAFHGRGFRPHGTGAPPREGNAFREGNGEPNGNRVPQPGKPGGVGGAGRRRRRRRR